MEVEAKFSIPDEQTFQQLLEMPVLAGYRLENRTVAKLYDRYLDTADGTIRAGGYACRIRRQNGRHLATLKGLGQALGAIHRRDEHEVDLPAPLAVRDWPPSTARDLALRLSGGAPLVPLFEIEQTRHNFDLHQQERTLFRLSLDRARLCRGGIGAETSLELEAELLDAGCEDELEQLADVLQQEWGLEPQSRSKFERGLALFGVGPASNKETQQMDVQQAHWELPDTEPVAGAGPDPQVELLPAPGIQPDDPMSEAGRKTFRFHYRRMVYNEPGTRQGEDIEALHDMRVATRRMRAAFRVFGEYYEPRAIAPHLKGLKRTGRALGPVRDLDVFRAKTQAYLAARADSHDTTEAATAAALPPGNLEGFMAALEAQRELDRQRMLAYLDGKKYARFKERFGQFVETEGMGSRQVSFDDDPVPYRVRHVAPMAIYRRLAAVRAYDEWVSIPNPPLERLHALRIACKRLRYAVEFFREVLGPDAKALIKTIVAVQDHLGDLQDAVVASNLLRSFARWGTWAPPESPHLPAADLAGAPDVEAYLAAKQAELQHLVDTFPQAWESITGPEFSQMVAESIVVL